MSEFDDGSYAKPDAATTRPVPERESIVKKPFSPWDRAERRRAAKRKLWRNRRRAIWAMSKPVGPYVVGGVSAVFHDEIATAALWVHGALLSIASAALSWRG